MPSTRRSGLLQSRRRRDEDGEEEGSIIAELHDLSPSEGSVVSDVEEEEDFEGSDASLEENVPPPPHPDTKRNSTQTKSTASGKQSTTSNGAFKPSTDTEAMLNGLKTGSPNEEIESLHFDAASLEGFVKGGKPRVTPSRAPRNETSGERNRHEHMEHPRTRGQPSASVHNRGGFFLHDDRLGTAAGANGRPVARPRGRGSAQLHAK